MIPLLISLAIVTPALLLVLWLNQRGEDIPCTCWQGNHLCELHTPEAMK